MMLLLLDMVAWDPARLPQHCSCGARFSIEHSFSCPKGGFPTIRHNEIRDLTANLLTEVCHGVQVKLSQGYSRFLVNNSNRPL